MSGGHFDYNQRKIDWIADAIEDMIFHNDSEEVDEYGYRRGYGFQPITVDRFKEAVLRLREAAVYAQRIDWLVSGDDGEDTFHERLAKDLANVRANG